MKKYLLVPEKAFALRPSAEPCFMARLLYDVKPKVDIVQFSQNTSHLLTFIVDYNIIKIGNRENCKVSLALQNNEVVV